MASEQATGPLLFGFHLCKCRRFDQNLEPSDNFEYTAMKKARPRNEIIVKTKFWFITR